MATMVRQQGAAELHGRLQDRRGAPGPRHAAARRSLAAVARFGVDASSSLRNWVEQAPGNDRTKGKIRAHDRGALPS